MFKVKRPGPLPGSEEFPFCQGCRSYCCTRTDTTPIVQVTDSDLDRLVDWLKISRQEVERAYTEIRDGQRVIKRQTEVDGWAACIFAREHLGEENCTIYGGRPAACVGFPAPHERMESGQCILRLQEEAAELDPEKPRSSVIIIP